MQKMIKLFLLFSLIIMIAPNTNADFIRGDVNNDKSVDITDSINILQYLFLGGDLIACEDVADVNDDGKIDISDAVILLNYLFLEGQSPSEPFIFKGIDPTKDNWFCSEFIIGFEENGLLRWNPDSTYSGPIFSQETLDNINGVDEENQNDLWLDIYTKISKLSGSSLDIIWDGSPTYSFHAVVDSNGNIIPITKGPINDQILFINVESLFRSGNKIWYFDYGVTDDFPPTILEHNLIDNSWESFPAPKYEDLYPDAPDILIKDWFWITDAVWMPLRKTFLLSNTQMSESKPNRFGLIEFDPTKKEYKILAPLQEGLIGTMDIEMKSPTEFYLAGTGIKLLRLNPNGGFGEIIQPPFPDVVLFEQPGDNLPDEPLGFRSINAISQGDKYLLVGYLDRIYILDSESLKLLNIYYPNREFGSYYVHPRAITYIN